ncbi:hypothetical protein QUF55_09685, partial [Clostridiaceae bacterium HSG29]|nr:hypothetical protein [Clostridiaceae bacterium HSG29]
KIRYRLKFLFKKMNDIYIINEEKLQIEFLEESMNLLEINISEEMKMVILNVLYGNDLISEIEYIAFDKMYNEFINKTSKTNSMWYN